MSTRLVVTGIGFAVGSFFGYPQLGLVLGSTIGAAIDPDQVSGRRIDIKPLTVSEGIVIPKIYATHVVSGTVIIAGELDIVKTVDRSGKGGPEVTNDNAFRTYAMLLSEGIVDLVKIERNGKIVFDATEGDFARQALNETIDFTFQRGTDTQTEDPDLEALLGVGNVSAFLFRSYIVFPNDNLTEYGGAIPQYRFTLAEVSSSSQQDTEFLRVIEVSTIFKRVFENPLIDERNPDGTPHVRNSFEFTPMTFSTSLTPNTGSAVGGLGVAKGALQDEVGATVKLIGSGGPGFDSTVNPFFSLWVNEATGFPNEWELREIAGLRYSRFGIGSFSDQEVSSFDEVFINAGSTTSEAHWRILVYLRGPFFSDEVPGTIYESMNADVGIPFGFCSKLEYDGDGTPNGVPDVRHVSAPITAGEATTDVWLAANPIWERDPAVTPFWFVLNGDDVSSDFFLYGSWRVGVRQIASPSTTLNITTPVNFRAERLYSERDFVIAVKRLQNLGCQSKCPVGDPATSPDPVTLSFNDNYCIDDKGVVIPNVPYAVEDNVPPTFNYLQVSTLAFSVPAQFDNGRLLTPAQGPVLRIGAADDNQTFWDNAALEGGVSGTFGVEYPESEDDACVGTDQRPLLVPGTSLLSSIVTDLEARTGLDASEIDVTELTDLVSGFQLNREVDAQSYLNELASLYTFDTTMKDGKLHHIKRGQSITRSFVEDDLIDERKGS